MSGEGVIAARPEDAPGAETRPVERPLAFTRLCADGAHRVGLVVPVQHGFSMVPVELALEPDAAEQLGRELLEYAALVRDRIGLSCGPTAALPEAGSGGKVTP